MAETGTRTLRDLITERGWLGEPQVLELFLQVATDLDTAHSDGTLHGDIKPEKIVRSRTGRYGLIEYAAARLGSARYISPERARRMPVDARSDIYSLGVVMFETATGRPPFEGMNYQVMQAHLSGTPPLPKSLRAEISTGFQRVILTAMAKDPAARYQNARGLADALRELIKEYADGVRPAAAEQAYRDPGAPAAELPTADPGTPAGTMSGRRPSASPEGPVSAPEPVAAVPAARPGSRRVAPGRLRPVRRRPKKTLLLAGIGGLAVVVAAVLFLAGGGAKVPDAYGLTEGEAGELAVRKALAVAVREHRDDTLPAGRVIGQEPGPGARARKGDTIHLVLSTGQVVVPDIDSSSIQYAHGELARLGIRVAGVDSGYSDRVSAGLVSGVQPRPGIRVDARTGVRLTVVVGRATCPECGTRRAPGARFCMNCGHQFAQ